jgi:hypothetical protein
VVLNVAMDGICRGSAVWCRKVVRCTTWYNSGDMNLWYVVQGKDSRTVTELYIFRCHNAINYCP